MGVRTADLPDLGAANDAASFVADYGGSGRLTGTAVKSWIGTTMAPMLPTIAALRANTSYANLVMVAGYAANADGGEGAFVCVPGDTTNFDNGGTIIVDAADRRWYRQGVSNAVSFEQFGGIGNTNSGTVRAANAAAFANAVAWLQRPGSNGGRLLFGPRAYYFGATLSFSPGASGWHDVILEGAAASATILDFSSAPVGAPGIDLLSWGGRFGLRNFTVQRAPGVGIHFNASGSSQYVSRFHVDNVIVDGCGGDGLYIDHCYVARFDGVEARNNGGSGFNLNGFNDALTFIRCWAGGDAAAPNGGNANAGWRINGLIYSTFINCDSDWNGGPGWWIQNVRGVVCSTCGAEQNQAEGFLVETSASSGDVHALVLQGCFANINSHAAADGYANFLGVHTSDARSASVLVEGCADVLGAGQTISVVMNGTSGALNVRLLESALTGSTVRSGSTALTNLSVAGLSCLAQLATNQAVVDSTLTVVAIATTTINTLQANVTGNVIVIPAGVNYVRVSAGVYWAAGTAGDRYIQIYRNGVVPAGFPAQQIASSGGAEQMSLASAVIAVAANDTISLRAQCVIGSGTLNIVANNETFLSVEAVG